jgi:membrane protein
MKSARLNTVSRQRFTHLFIGWRHAMKHSSVWTLLKDTFHAWNEDKATRLASSTAYYTLFSLAPLLVIAIAIAGFFFTQQTAQQQIINQISSLAGSKVASSIQGMISNSQKNNSDVIATIIGVVLLLLGASGVFSSLQDSLNTIWEVKPDPHRGIRSTIFNRVFSFAMVLVIGFLLLVSLIASWALSFIGVFFQNLLPAGAGGLVVQLINLVVSFAVITLLFALIYKVLPDVRVNWRNIWIGAAFTAVLFVIGKELIGLYLSRSSVTSVYGAAGSGVVILLWVYYSAMILYFGAEFTQVHAHADGGVIEPKRGAVWMTAKDLADQGIPRERPRGRQPVARPATGAARPEPAYPSGLVPAMAVAGAGQGEQVSGTGHPVDEVRLPSYNTYPQNAGPVLPPMPLPMRALTAVLGALVATVGVTGVLFARSNSRRVDARLAEQRKQMQEEARRLMEEAGKVRAQAHQMHTTTGRLDDVEDRLRDQSTKLRRASQK